MASSLAAQLSQIAATSTHQLNLKAQRAAHSQSLIFDRKVAGSQDFDTIFEICHEGFEELCTLDPRFTAFRKSIFSPQSKTEDRLQMTASQNEELDTVLESFLGLVGSRLLLNPAVKAVDWLIRRFRVHEHNTSFLVLTFLPYHTTPLFLNLMTLLPEDFTSTLKCLYPYKRSLTLPPRRAIVHSATTNKPFFAAFNQYVLQVAKSRCEYQGLISFWAGVTTEAVAGMLDSAKAGKLEIEKRNTEDVLLRILPILNEAFALKEAPQLVVGSFMICVILANKGSLSEVALDSLMEAVAGAWNQDITVSGFTCLSVLAQRKKNPLPRKVTKAISQVQNCADILKEISEQYSVAPLVLQLVRGCASEIKKGRLAPSLTVVHQIVEGEFLDDSSTVTVLKIFLQAVAEALAGKGSAGENSQQELSDVFAKFNESDKLGPLFQKSIQESGIDLTALEMSLQAVITTGPPGPSPVGDTVMKDTGASAPAEDIFFQSLESLRDSTMTETTFLLHEPPSAFEPLARAFLQAGRDKEKLSLFSDLKILDREKALEEPRYFSFFIRFFSGPYSPTSRAQAIQTLTTFLKSLKHKNLDLQALLPYSIAALMDPSVRVRNEATVLLAEIDRKCAKATADDQEEETIWGHNKLYGREKQPTDVTWLQARQTHKIVHRILVPALEEYTLDPGHVRAILLNAIRGPRESEGETSKSTDAGLKKSVRNDLFKFLCSHAVNSPLYSVKLRLLLILNEVGKVGSVTRTQALLPLFQQWQQLSSDAVRIISDAEGLSPREVEGRVFSIVSPKDPNAPGMLLSAALGRQDGPRETLVDAAFDRLNRIWPSLKEPQEVDAAGLLLEVALRVSESGDKLATHARGLLRRVDLSGPVLVSLLNKALGSTNGLDAEGPARKKRRASANKTVLLNDSDPQAMERSIKRMTYVLELIDGSKPENHPELAKGLIQVLSTVQQLKLRSHSEMSYILNLNLGILLAIVNAAKNSPAKKIDLSAIRADLIIDCVRTSESPAVQNTALLLVAGLSVLVPELVLHSVMPIFTFMGASVLRKDDAYSSHVVDQTIDQVVPPLIQSLRRQKRDLVSSTSELLLSFTAAFEHIPSYRRLRLFETLVDKLGKADFLYAILAMLANKYGMDKDAVKLMLSLASNTDAETQLTTYARYLDLVRDTLQPKPSLSRVLLGIGSEHGRDPHSVAIDLLQVLSYLFKHASLANKMSAYFESDADQTPANVNNLFSQILEQILRLAEDTRTIKLLNKACTETLGTFLGTLSLVDFIDTVEVLLGRSNDDLRRKVVKLTENRLDSAHVGDNVSRTRALEFSSVLVNLLQTSPDILLKHAAVACIGKISEKFGKKDPSAIIAAAKVIASDRCIGQTDDRIRLMGVLCLASMAEVLGEGIIPVLPEVLPRSLDLLRLSLAKGKENPSLHDAVFSFISALLIHIPWMISGDYLDSILQLSFLSANRSLSEASDENRNEALQLLAKRLDAKETFDAIERNWPSAVEQGSKAVIEALDITKAAIDKHPKSSTVKNVPILMTLLRRAFDLRRIQTGNQTPAAFKADEIDEVEAHVNEVTIRMIYKLNDTLFRPLFTELTDWAVNDLGKKDKPGQVARMTSFFKFLETFFTTLKSIVTGYSSYILEHTVEVLKTSRCNDGATKTLWLAAIRMLRSSFEHDRDEFWQSPTHLTAIASPLVNQLSHSTDSATLGHVTTEVIPAIVELAAAADSPDNHKELNTLIMGFMRAGGSKTGRTGSARGDNPYTRLAAVKCEQSLTERLGEEWLGLLPEMLPYISELMEDDDEKVEREVRKWVLMIEDALGEKLDDMLV